MTEKSVKEMFVEVYKDAIKRKNFNGNIYLDIFKKAGDQYIDYKKQSEDLLAERKQNKMTKLELLNKTTRIYDEIQRHELIAITFAAMFLECLIWDYAAVNTSKKMTEDYLGKISLLGKWQVIPKLVNNDKSISIDRKAITLLKKLIKERNNIVHSKSEAVPDTYDEIMEINKKERAITIDETEECISKCIQSLNDVDTTDYWYFNS